MEEPKLLDLVQRRSDELFNRIVQPYLANPLLRRGRKWDVRTYVLVTNVLPMRVYLFTESIVRYASTQYSSSSKDEGVVLTNTYVGKKLLGKGARRTPPCMSCFT